MKSDYLSLERFYRLLAQTALMDLSKAELEPFLAATGTLPMLEKRGNLQVYEGEAELKASLDAWKARTDHGIEFHHLTAAEMVGLQPGLAPRFTHGTFTPGWYSIADPKLYTEALANRFRANGSTLRIAEVTAISPANDGATLSLTAALNGDPNSGFTKVGGGMLVVAGASLISRVLAIG